MKSPLDTIIEQGAVRDKSSQKILLSLKNGGWNSIFVTDITR